MNGIIIVNQVIGHNAYKIERFEKECKKRNITISVFINDGTLAVVKDCNVVINLPRADFVIYLDKDIYLARLLEKAGYRLFNKADFIKMCDDKMLTFIACSNMNIPMPETYAGPLVYTSNFSPNSEFLNKIIDNLGFPMVVKKVYGSLGLGVYLIDDKKELEKFYKENCHSPVLFQKFIESSKSKSIRVLIIDGKPFGAFVRKNSDDFRSNFGVTAGSKELQNKEKYFNLANYIAQKLDIEYAGIDLLDDENGNPILCEINSNAFFEEFEKVTNLDVAKAYIDMIVRKINNEQK